MNTRRPVQPGPLDEALRLTEGIIEQIHESIRELHVCIDASRRQLEASRAAAKSVDRKIADLASTGIAVASR